MKNPTEIRNIALIGHGGDGKTSLAEAMLYSAKATDRLGKVPDGNTVMDFDPEEINRKISINLSAANFEWNGIKINILDTPGFFDFEGEVIQALHVADSALVVVGANGSVPVGCEKALDLCIKRKIPCMVFINQLDKENADYKGTLAALQNRYPKVLPVELPVKDESLIEAAASNDEELMMKYLEGEALSQDEIAAGLRTAIVLGDIIPAASGSAVQNKGVNNLLDLIVALMPSPVGRENIGTENGNPVTVKCDPNGKLICQIFKTITDPFVGKLSLFKVYSGSVKTGLQLYNVAAEKQEKVPGMYFPKGKKQDSADVIGAGDIGAFAKLQLSRTGDTLTDGAKIKMPDIIFPEPVYILSVSSAKQGEEDKVFTGLSKLIEEDNTIRISKNTETFETLISGMGESHVDVTCKKLKNKFGVEAVTGVPRIPYHETIKKPADADGKHKKQSGGHGQYGHAKIKFEPYYDGDFLFDEIVVGGTVPKQYIPAVEKGLLECIQRGVLAGYKVVNIKCTLYDGSYHDVDSSEMAFKIAASKAFKAGCAAAGPTLLEPIYSYKISVPEAYLGDIMGDMNRRRGRILGMDLVDGRQIISAEAPLAEMVKYANDLRSMTQGRGSYTFELVRYEEVPNQLIPAIVSASPFKRKDEDDD